MTPAIRMVDAAHPEQIPDGFTHAAVYINLKFAWPRAQVARFPHIIKISVQSAATWAAEARVIDVERGAAVPFDAPPFVDKRQALGHGDATVYANRSSLPLILAALGQRRPRLWIATLDNHPWVPEELAADLRAREHVTVDPARIWAIQNGKHDGYDTSVVFGTRDFSTPRGGQ